MRSFPEGVVGSVRSGSYHEPIASESDDRLPPAREIAALRVRLVRLGGRDPVARFESVSEPQPFSLEITHEVARELGPHIYAELDITAEVQRDRDGLIGHGRLVEFERVRELSARDTEVELRRWYRDNGARWDQVSDVSAELRSGS